MHGQTGGSQNSCLELIEDIFVCLTVSSLEVEGSNGHQNQLVPNVQLRRSLQRGVASYHITISHSLSFPSTREKVVSTSHAFVWWMTLSKNGMKVMTRVRLVLLNGCDIVNVLVVA